MIRALSIAAALMAAVVAMGTASAQVPLPPHRFFGSLTIDGQPAATGTVLTAMVNGTDCGNTTVSQAGRYVVTVLNSSNQPGCGSPSGATATFMVNGRSASQTPQVYTGGFEELNVTIGTGGGGGTVTPVAYNAATLNLEEERPCIPAAGQSACDALRQNLWNGNMAAWATQNVTNPDDVFIQTIIFRVRAGDPAVIRNIARILEAPYVKITTVRFAGDEWFELTNLGGGDQDISTWALTVSGGSGRVSFPAGTVLQAGQTRRFNVSGNLFPDSSGRLILRDEFLQLLADDTSYSADPNTQPPPPNLQGFNLS